MILIAQVNMMNTGQCVCECDMDEDERLRFYTLSTHLFHRAGVPQKKCFGKTVAEKTL